MILDSLVIAGAFLLGSIPTGYILGRLHGVDLRKSGSGNIGATNAQRTLGRRAGTLTLLGDMLKGALAVTIVPTLLPSFSESPYQFELRLLCGLAAIVGHCYSPFLKFRGGKGVATSLAVFLVLFPEQALATVVLFLLVVKLSGFVSLGSILSALALAGLVLAEVPQEYSATTKALAVTISALIVYRHRANLLRLLKGEELSSRAAKQDCTVAEGTAASPLKEANNRQRR